MAEKCCALAPLYLPLRPRPSPDRPNMGDVDTAVAGASDHALSTSEKDRTLGRSYLEKAFKNLLVPTPLVPMSLLLSLIKVLTYMSDRRSPRLCRSLPGLCDVLWPLPIVALGFYPVFITLALFTLDYLLCVSPTFQISEMSNNMHPMRGESENREDSQSSTANSPVDLDFSGSHRALKILTVAAYPLAALWGSGIFTGIAEVTLIVIKDHPFGNPQPVDMTRIVLCSSEAVCDALIAFSIGRAALHCSRARKMTGAARVPLEARTWVSLHLLPLTNMRAHWAGWQRPLAGISALGTRKAMLDAMKAHWHRRTLLDQCIVYLVGSFGVGLISAAFFLVHILTARDYRHPGPQCDTLLPLTLTFGYLSLLTFHRYRSTGVRPGVIVCFLTSAFAFILVLFWVLLSLSFLLIVVYSLVCDHTSHPPSGPVPCSPLPGSVVSWDL